MRSRRSVKQFMLTESKKTGPSGEDYITEASLSAKEIAKRSNLSVFLRKWIEGEPFEKTDGSQITLVKPSIPDFKNEYWQFRKDESKDNLNPERKLYAHITGKLKGSVDIPTTDGGTVRLSNLLKTSEFGGAGGSKGPSGEDWEAMIAVGLAVIDGKSVKTLPDEWKRVEKYWGNDEFREQAMSLANSFKSSGYSPMKQTGSGKGGSAVSSIWKKLYEKHGGGGQMNNTPKTDVLGGGVKISLKKVGGSQAMSSKNQEAFATFEAAMLLYGEKYPGEVNKILTSLKNDVLDFERSGYKGTIGQLKKDLESAESDPSKFTKSDLTKLKSYKDDMDASYKNADKLTVLVNDLFQKSPRMKQLFLFEASSGSVKFGDKSISRADRLVEFDPEKGEITADWDITTPDSIASIMNKYKIYFSFKTSGDSPYISLRGGMLASLGESAEYTEDCPTFSSIIKESFNENEFGRTLLSEEYSQLDEFQLFQKIKSEVSDIKSKVLNSKVVQKFLQIWDRIKQKMSKAFEWIKKQGNKALSFLLEFFGMKLSKVNLSGPIELFTQ